MGFLWFFQDKHFQRLEVLEDFTGVITAGADLADTITIKSFPFEYGSVSIERKETSEEFGVFHNGQHIGKLSGMNFIHLSEKGQDLSICYTDRKPLRSHFYAGDQKELTFSSELEGNADVLKKGKVLSLQKNSDFSFRKLQDKWMLDSGRDDLYLNGEKVQGSVEVKLGDEIFWPFIVLRFLEEDVLEIASFDEIETDLPRTVIPVSEMKKKYPVYRRTPRMIYELPKEDVQLAFPSQESEDSNRGLMLIILPPLVMLIMMGMVALFQPRGLFMLVSIAMFGMTLVTSSAQYFKDRKRFKSREEKRRRVYNQYLESKREELHEKAEEQKHVLTFHYPSFERMKYLTEEISDRIWERTPESKDFMEFRIGTGTVPASFKLSVNSADMSSREVDDLMEQSQIMEKVYKELKHLPVAVHLSHGAMGLVGKEAVVKTELHQLIGQLSFFHSYHDVRFVFIFNEKEYQEWEWMKWLPHFQLPNTFAKGMIYNEQTRDQLLSSLYEILRERDLEQDKEKLRFSPHLVFVVTNQQLISEHVILEYLEGEHPHLGFSVLFAAETKESLSENIHTLIRYINEEEGDILIKDKKAVQIPFRLDQHTLKNNETYARTLKTLDHQIGMTNSIPSSVSFLEMFRAKDADDLQIDQKWLTRESSKSLAVPIGLKGKDDLVELNLHEKAHGPHGLLAGTTGSGKSEFLQTYILSLAVNFHPHEVAFLLIDYKGGGMAQPFKNMPHLLGTITNIEGSKNFSARALASIRSELKRRQRLFDQYQVNHINDYTTLYKKNKAEDPLPHLFLISDEFAELKSEEPDFIRELVSAARIGRSLGVHLILATQKPGGVIDDQIWSNSRFKVALKVQDANDSREILKNSDAAAITVTGRGYLQVGNNEVYDLFQSAWSGAPYEDDTFGLEDEIAIVSDLGLIPLTDVSSSEKRAKKEGQSQIEAIVDKIEQVQEELHIKKLPSPWLPPLEERIFIQSAEPAEASEFQIAMIDEPEKQSQTPYRYQLMDDGNIGVFGSSGYGKSYTVMNLLLQFAKSYNPEEIHYYIFDFGNGSLLPLRQLPHTADYFMADQERKIEKFMRLMKEEMSRRKNMLQSKEVSSVKMYNALSDQKLPLIFITIDNYDLVKEELQDLEAQFTQFVRDGQSLGIYMIYTATRINAMRQSLINNLKTKIVHYLMDSTESYSVLGKVPYALEPLPGRAIIKKDEAFFAQMLLPADGEDDFAILDKIKLDVQGLKEKYAAFTSPEPIPMLPANLTMINFAQDIRVKRDEGLIPVGLDEESVSPVYINLSSSRHCLVLGQTQKGKTNVLKVILNTVLLQQSRDIGIFDDISRGLSQYANEENIHYMSGKDDITAWLDAAENALYERERSYLDAIGQGALNNLQFSPILLIIDGLSRFLQTGDSMIEERLSKFMKNYAHLGFNVIAAGNHTEFTKGYDSFTNELKQVRQAIVLMKKSDQSLLNLAFDRKEPEIIPGFGYHVENGRETKIQIPLCVIERKILI